jgi:hypothetical protein
VFDEVVIDNDPSSGIPWDAVVEITTAKTYFLSYVALHAPRNFANPLPIGGSFDGPCRTKMDHTNRHINV